MDNFNLDDLDLSLARPAHQQVQDKTWACLLPWLTSSQQAQLKANQSWQHQCNETLRQYKYGEILALRYLHVCFSPGRRTAVPSFRLEPSNAQP